MIDIEAQFDIIINQDTKEYHFNSVDNNFCSYRVAFSEADNLSDAKISVYKGILKGGVSDES